MSQCIRPLCLWWEGRGFKSLAWQSSHNAVGLLSKAVKLPAMRPGCWMDGWPCVWPQASPCQLHHSVYGIKTRARGLRKRKHIAKHWYKWQIRLCYSEAGWTFNMAARLFGDRLWWSAFVGGHLGIHWTRPEHQRPWGGCPESSVIQLEAVAI